MPAPTIDPTPIEPAPRDLAVVDSPEAARSLLDPVRGALLSALQTPGSATVAADAIGTTRQRANYHVRALERCGLLTFLEDRPRRGVKERVLLASARTYVLSPSLLGPRAPDPRRLDRLSSRYLLALATRIVREVATLVRRADQAEQPLATLSIDTDLRFASAAARAAFTEELSSAINALAGRYHDEQATGGRWHRLAIIAYPRPTDHDAHPHQHEENRDE